MHEYSGNNNCIEANNMKNPIEYIIVAVPFHADAATQNLGRFLDSQHSSHRLQIHMRETGCVWIAK
jgi:hypothetical protein